MMDETRWEQRYLRLALTKPQARKPKAFNPIRRTETTAKAIWVAAQNCSDASTDLVVLHSDLFRWVKSKRFDSNFGKYRRANPPPYRALPSQGGQQGKT
jgi:hypothetical protein